MTAGSTVRCDGVGCTVAHAGSVSDQNGIAARWLALGVVWSRCANHIRVTLVALPALVPTMHTQLWIACHHTRMTTVACGTTISLRMRVSHRRCGASATFSPTVLPRRLGGDLGSQPARAHRAASVALASPSIVGGGEPGRLVGSASRCSQTIMCHHLDFPIRSPRPRPDDRSGDVSR